MHRRLLAAILAAALVALLGGSAGAAPTFTTLHSFTGGADGAGPAGTLIADAAGNLYGVTATGGASDQGTVFRLSPAGAETVLHSFAGLDGARPLSGVIADAAGNLYGTTVVGGASDLGTVFVVTPDGIETVLHSFAGGSDGAHPDRGGHALAANGAGIFVCVSDMPNHNRFAPNDNEDNQFNIRVAPGC